MQELANYADDDTFQEEFRAVKNANKWRLTRLMLERLGVSVDPQSMFDMHVKRIHEYKRQLLYVLYAITRYNRIRHRLDGDVLPRTLIFSGKTARLRDGEAYHPPHQSCRGYRHQRSKRRRAVENCFIPNYDVQTAEDIVPAADLSQQISTAGTEASGTGNMNSRSTAR